ncbi:MAG TPA: 50S ribosomal protein L4, partial [Acidimicrobiales bacterium]|nr:50S ribosomal protein L4 [Acidimicrobiales bacterium]
KKDRPDLVTRTATRRNMAGHDLGKVELDPAHFGLEPNRAVLHQVVTAQLAAARAGTQSTKTRAEVRGGGAKPFSQKGTGRARQGSSRSPSHAGGGVALGPKPRSYAQHTPKKMVRLALLSALSDRAIGNRVAVLDAWAIGEPKTKDAATTLRKLRIAGTVVVVLAEEEVVVAQSLRNLPEAHITTFGQLTAHDVLRADWILFSDRTLPGGVKVVEGSEPKKAAGAKKAATSSSATKAAPKAAATAAEDPAQAEPAVDDAALSEEDGADA